MSKRFKTLDDLAGMANVRGKTALVRLDLNVPMEKGRVTDITRIQRAAPTLRDLSAMGMRVVMLSHFGRPKGNVVRDMSLEPVIQAVADVLGHAVTFARDCIGDEARSVVRTMADGDFAILENTRFHPGEEANDPEFASHLAELGDVFVADAFSAAHRAHASTEAVGHLLPSYAGRSMEAELQALEAALTDPERPLVAVVGGAKVSSKFDLLDNLIEKVDQLVIGGGMANTFLFAQGHPVGASLCEHDLAETAREILANAESRNCEIILPEDAVVAREFKAGAPARTVALQDVGPKDMILDVGAASLARMAVAFEAAKTVVWNGPMGAFEIAPFDNGTNTAARHVAMLTRARRVTSVAGGGDTVAALNKAGAAQDFSYISTAGGAFLEWLEGKTLPGVEVLYRA